MKTHFYSGLIRITEVSKAYNLVGKEMASRTSIYLDNNSTIKVDFGKLAEGLYFMLIEGEGEKMIQKMIINR